MMSKETGGTASFQNSQSRSGGDQAQQTPASKARSTAMDWLPPRCVPSQRNRCHRPTLTALARLDRCQADRRAIYSTGATLLNAQEEIENLLTQIRIAAPSSVVARASDQISVFFSAYMEPDQAEPFAWLNTTPSRRRMFDLLLKRRGRVVSKSALYDVRLSKWDAETDPKVVDAHICHLRHDLENTPFEGMIESIWGAGYRLRTEAEGPAEVKHTNRSRHHVTKAAA